jgi:hypothetical protein
VAFDYRKYLDFLETNNHNFFRLWTWEQSRWTLETADDNYWFNPEGPYVRTGPGNALDGKAKWDLTRFDQAYFDRMRQRVVEAGQRGMYVSIMLFDGWSVVSNQSPALNNPWKGHPYNAANNVNGINGDVNGDANGREVHTLATPAVTALQEAYIKKVIDTLNDLDNVLYEIANEAPNESTEWQYHLVDFIHAYEGGKPKQHPVGMTGRFEWSVNDLLNSGAEWISPGGSAYMWNPPAADGRAVVIVDTDHLWGIGGDYMWVWKSFTRGLNPIFMDGYDGAGYGVGGQGFNFSDPTWVKLRANMGYTRAYAEQVNLAAMTPQPSRCSTGYCLANPNGPNAEFIVFQPENGAFTVNLGGLSGSFAVEWLNPENGSKTAGAAVTGGATVTFTPPFNNGAVIYLKQRGGAANTPTATPATLTPQPPTATPTPPPDAQFPNSPLLDNFNRPNGAIGVNWGQQPQDFDIANHRLALPASGVAIWRPQVFGPDQQAFITLANVDDLGTSDHTVGVVLKAALDGDTLMGGFRAVYVPSAGELRLARYDAANGWTTIGYPVKAIFQAGDRLGVHADAGGAVEFYRNGGLLATLNAGLLPDSGGQIGIIAETPAETPLEAVVDNFGGGNAVDGPPPTYTIEIDAATVGQGSVQVQPTGVITCGQLITLTAIPAAGWVFAGWTGDVTESSNPFTYNIYGSLLVVANFVAESEPRAYTMAMATRGQGTVSVQPEGPYRGGQVLELEARALPGWRFAGWAGALRGSDNPLQFQIRNDMAITATFERAETIFLPHLQNGTPGAVTGTQESCQ